MLLRVLRRLSLRPLLLQATLSTNVPVFFRFGNIFDKKMVRVIKKMGTKKLEKMIFRLLFSGTKMTTFSKTCLATFLFTLLVTVLITCFKSFWIFGDLTSLENNQHVDGDKIMISPSTVADNAREPLRNHTSLSLFVSLDFSATLPLVSASPCRLLCQTLSAYRLASCIVALHLASCSPQALVGFAGAFLC